MRTAELGRFAYYDIDGPELVLDERGWRRRQTLMAIPAGPGFSHKTLRPWISGQGLGVRTVHVDLPGTGRASLEEHADYTFPSFIQDLEAIRTRIDAERVAVLGHGWGAALAVEYALARPANVAALVLVAPLRCFGATGQDVDAQIRQVERTDPTLGPRYATDVLPAFEAAKARRGPWEPVEKHSWWGEMLLTQFSRSPPREWFTALQQERWGLRAYAAYKGAAMSEPGHPMASYDLAQRALGLSTEIPVLIVSSNHDANYVAKAETHAVPLHRAIPVSELLTWDDVGHFPFVERPHDFSAVVARFLARR